jgi:hypothetical protein
VCYCEKNGIAFQIWGCSFQCLTSLSTICQIFRSDMFYMYWWWKLEQSELLQVTDKLDDIKLCQVHLATCGNQTHRCDCHWFTLVNINPSSILSQPQWILCWILPVEGIDKYMHTYTVNHVTHNFNRGFIHRKFWLKIEKDLEFQFLIPNNSMA